MNQRMNKVLVILGLVIASCSGTEQAGIYMPENMERREKIRYQQYLVQGKQLYQTHCSNCHQTNGQGLAKLYPPLAKSDYLMEDLQRSACIIKFGMEGMIKVNGTTFQSLMPGVNHLSNLEIAEILTYISNNWGNENGMISVQETSKFLLECEAY
ncbi:MAG: cytochrome c [Cyclobacteriaceae bacterium]